MSYSVRAYQGVKQSISRFNPAQKDFGSRVPVHFTRGHFTVKTVASKRELWQVMTLRYEVFHKEYMNKRLPYGIDRDRFDQHADHLVIVDNRINKIVGTYRLISSETTEDFYSKTEFNISDLNSKQGCKIELSRACIQQDYRNGATITLLWRGIMEYLAASHASWLFGMGSIKTVDADQAAAVFKCFVEDGSVDSGFKIHANPGFRIPDFSERLSSAQATPESREMMPTLLKSYIRAGAVLAGDPAVDRAFNCTDFFVILEVAKMSDAYLRKYSTQ
jgi:putative hemolysin